MAKSLNSRIDAFFEDRTKSKEEYQRLLVFLLGIIAGIIGYPLHIIGIWGSGNIVLQGMSIAIEACLIADFALYYYKKVSLYNAFAAYGIIMQVMQSAKILYIAHTGIGGGYLPYSV